MPTIFTFMSLFAVRDGKLKYINKTNCPDIIVMADWASKANYNNPLFTIYHTLQSAKHKGIYGGGGGGGGDNFLISAKSETVVSTIVRVHVYELCLTQSLGL